jgi:DNA primase
MAAYLDFEQIKVSNTIDEVARRLGLDLVKSGASLRCKCPACESEGVRNLAITPDKGLWYCFTFGKGGDVIALVAHVKGITVKEAAEFLAGKPAGNTSKEKTKEVKPAEGFKPLDYLEHDHPAVIALGIEPADAERIGCGFAPRGMMKGTVAFPIRSETGSLLGYIGVEDCKVPNTWKF